MLAALGLAAQEDFDFDFGFGDEGSQDSSLPLVSMSGEISTGFTLFPGEWESWDSFKAVELGDIVSGALNFSLSGPYADAYIGLGLTPNFEDPAKILSLDEAWIRAFFGGFTLEAGLLKLSWGRADVLGPLDVVNPLDYSDLSSLQDQQEMKLSRPMIHVSYWFSGDVPLSIEGVYLPWFQGDLYATEGRWVAQQLTDTTQAMLDAINGALTPTLGPGYLSLADISGMGGGVQTTGLEYSQWGLRMTTTLGPVDLGLQYYSGFPSRPEAVLNRSAMSTIDADAATLASASVAAQTAQTTYQTALTALGTKIASAPSDASIPGLAAAVDLAYGALLAASAAAESAALALETALGNAYSIGYSRYHQVGIDYAQSIWGFNIRAEFAANLTADLDGTNGAVYNPSLAWALGVYRDLFWGVDMLLQANQSIRLFNGQVGSDPVYDVEAAARDHATATRITLSFSKAFDDLTLRFTTLWGIEDMDFLIIPSLSWAQGGLGLSLTGGVFLGDSKGELGQFAKHSYLKLGMSYSF
jgi:hypothetical protein